MVARLFFVLSATAMYLRTIPRLSTLAHHGRVSSELKVEQLRAANEFLLGTNLFVVYRVMNETMNTFNTSTVSLPAHIRLLLHDAKGDQDITPESIDKARGILNNMLETAQDELDAKTMTCKTFHENNRATAKQVETDLSRLGEVISDLERVKTDSLAGIQSSDDEIQKIGETRIIDEISYNNIRAADEKEMEVRKSDLAVAEFILRLTKCKSAKSFLSLKPTIRECEQDTRKSARFDDDGIHKAVMMLSTTRAQRAVEHALLKASDTTTGVCDGLKQKKCTKTSSCVWTKGKILKRGKCVARTGKPSTAAAVAEATGGSSTPASTRKQANKCTLSTPNCGLLHDSMSLMWGDMKDKVDELDAEMRRKSKIWAERQEELNQAFSLYVTQKRTNDGQLLESTSGLNAVQQEQVNKQREARDLQKEFAREWGACKAQINEILFAKICGVKKVRGELAKHKSSKVKPKDILDCQIADWVPQDCSVPCDNKLKGGVQTMRREVVQMPNTYGVVCPVLTYQKSCNQIPCPIDCKMGPWSPFGTCSKECGGGVMTRSRLIVGKPKNGGASCEAVTDSAPCNSGSCDRDCVLSNWNTRPCTVACGGGVVIKRKKVTVPSRGNGKCPKKTSHFRLRSAGCNAQHCVGDEECVAKIDMVIGLDGSGSVRKKGFAVLKTFASKFVSQFRGAAEKGRAKKGKNKSTEGAATAAKIGVVQFGNGALDDEGNVAPAKIVQSLSPDIAKTASAIDALTWQKGFTNMAQAFSAADGIFMEGRKNAQSVMVIITDGKPSFRFQTASAVKKMREKGTKVIIIAVKSFPGKMIKLLKSWASIPVDTNFIHIKGLKKLKDHMDEYVNKALVHACPKSVSPSAVQKILRKQEKLYNMTAPFE